MMRCRRYCNRLIVVLLAMLFSRAAADPAVPLYRIDVKSPQDLRELFQHSGGLLPLVSAHRGGEGDNHPENCLATFQHTLTHTFAIMEVDPRYTADKAIVLHHDARLDRTTTGTGLVSDHTLAQLKTLRLKGRNGKPTNFQIPTLEEALQWARGRTILILDSKDVPVADRVRAITAHKAESYAMLIVYSFKDARTCYDLNRNIMMEVMIPNLQKAVEFEKTGVPWENVVAFVGHSPPQDPALYEYLHAKGVSCFVGSSRNLDRQVITGQVADIQQRKPHYQALIDRKADVIETDLPREVGALLHANRPIPKAKRRFFIPPPPPASLPPAPQSP